MKAVSTMKNTRIEMRFESMNLEKLFHMLHGLRKMPGRKTTKILNLDTEIVRVRRSVNP